jgi:hypothetical protein
MNVHLVTVIGSDVSLLPHMLRHYRRIGIDSIIINLNLKGEDDPVQSEVDKHLSEFRRDNTKIIVNNWVERWSDDTNANLFNRTCASRPGDWYVLADLDEFQAYPHNLFDIINDCERLGFDYIEGCIIDRIAADGGLPTLRYDSDIEEQFPLGCVFTYRVLGGFPLKVVAAKGHVQLPTGNHYAVGGIGCPMDRHYIPVYHYKWAQGLLKRMEYRANNASWQNGYKVECRKCLDYFRQNNGRIDITDPNLLVSECQPEYKYWGYILDKVKAYKSRQLTKGKTPDPR